ncbi:MAG: histidinol-phosphate transaminase [Xanthomonadales bacterium]|nr:histidinol-phosphate transaminase [Xanthomonadales bacterium]
MNVLDLVRDDLRSFSGYSSARREFDAVMAAADLWLNANESPYPNPADQSGSQRRYPEPQPAALRQAMATLYDVDPSQLLLGRGSDEGIDLLVRALCRPGRDAVVVCPPVFGMYAVSARLQGAPLLEVSLKDAAEGFGCDLDEVSDRARRGSAKLVFLCSPANPTGQSLRPDDVAALAATLAGRALLVVDEAYIEFSDQPSCVRLLERHANLVILRTLSKAHGLAATRVGAVLAAPALINVLRNCQAPYPLPQASVSLAHDALTDTSQSITRQRVAMIRAERERLAGSLAALPGVRRVYPGGGNFLLVRFSAADRALAHLLAAGIVVRDVRGMPQLGDALRISVGSESQNRRLEAALGEVAA